MGWFWIRAAPPSPVTELTVTSADTGYSRTSKSLGDGAYSLPDLPIGNYTLTVTANGFSQVRGKGRKSAWANGFGLICV